MNFRGENPQSDNLLSRFGLLLNPRRLAERLHRDERGAISVLGVWTIFLLTILLGMVFNVGRHLDDKLRMQNAADAAVYSGTLTVTRGVNAITYSNHLLCEVFALTAYMREGNQRYAERFTPDTLAEWFEAARAMEQAAAGLFPKFENLGKAIQEKIGGPNRLQNAPELLRNALEQDRSAGPQSIPPGEDERTLGYEGALVVHFGNMESMHADLTLSIFEYLLRGRDGTFPVDNQTSPRDALEGGPITQFQKAVVEMTPEMAQLAADEIARRHGSGFTRQHRGQDLRATMYRADATRFENYREDDRMLRTLPVVNPTAAGGDINPTTEMGVDWSSDVDFSYFRTTSPFAMTPPDNRYYIIAYDTRRNLAEHYLGEWIRVWADEYFTERDARPHPGPRLGRFQGSLSQLAYFWRVFTRAQLKKLLEEEFPRSNLPFVIRGENSNSWRHDGSSPYDHAKTYFQPDQYALESEYNFVAVVSWPHLREFAGGVFKNPLNAGGQTSAVAFAQASMFIPARRLRYSLRYQDWEVPIFDNRMELDGSSSQVETGRVPYTDNWPSTRRDWSLFNQNWRTRLVPVSNPYLLEILADQNINLQGIDLQQLQQINMH